MDDTEHKQLPGHLRFEAVKPDIDALPIKARIKALQTASRREGQELSWGKAKQLYRELQSATMYKSTRYTLWVYNGAAADVVVKDAALKGRCTYISLKRNDGEPIDSWADKQAIKNIFAGPGREGIEIFPAEQRLVDAANQYHLFILPEGSYVPFCIAGLGGGD